MNLSRRGLFLGGGALLAAPAIVRVGVLMPISQPKWLFPNLIGMDVGVDAIEWVTRAEMFVAARIEWEQILTRILKNSPPFMAWADVS